MKERDAKPILEELSRKVPSARPSTSKARVEIEPVKDAEVIFVEGKPVAARKKEQLFPVLVNVQALHSLPKFVVDMGAVPHVCSGADVMAPGVRKVEGEFQSGTLVVIVDEKYGKYLAVGRSLADSGASRMTKRGRVVQNLHWVGDLVWELVKTPV